MNTNTIISALEIIDAIRSFGAETAEEAITVLEDGEALTHLGFTDSDQDAIEEAHALLLAEVKKTVPIGIHNGNTFDAVLPSATFSVKITERESTKVHSLIIRDAQSRDAAVQSAIKKVYGESAAFLQDIHHGDPRMIYGEAEVALYGRARALSTGLLCIEVEQKPSSVTIGNTTFTANRTTRSVEAVSAIAKAKAAIESRGYVIDTKGPSAGSAGRFKVYVYPTAWIHMVGEKNRAADASFIISVQYMKGQWFASPTVVAESMAKGLSGIAKHLEDEDAHAVAIHEFAQEAMAGLRERLERAMAEHPGAHVAF